MLIHMRVENPTGGWNIFDNYDFVASESDPYDGAESYYSTKGITVVYEETEEGGRFEIDFGGAMTAGAIASGEITIIVALYDENNYVWGNVHQQMKLILLYLMFKNQVNFINNIKRKIL